MHTNFTFNQYEDLKELLPVKEIKVLEPFQNEKDPFMKVMKRIMYAEGDTLNAGDE